MTVPEAAAVLEVSPALVYQLCAAGRLAHRRIGLGRGTIRITDDDLAAYLESVKVDAAPPAARAEPRVMPMRRPPVPDFFGAELRRRETKQVKR